MRWAGKKTAAFLLASVTSVGLALPAWAGGNDHDDHDGGGGGTPPDEATCEQCMKGMHAMRGRGGGDGHKHMSLVYQPYWSMSRDAIYTLVGLEMVKQDSRGWKGGFGMASGMNLGVSGQTNAFHYGGGIFGKDFTAGAFSLTTGVLLGFGRTADILPAVLPAGITNFYMFGVAAPRVGIAWTPYRRLEIGLEGTYLFTTNPNVGNGIGAMLRVSSISWGGRRHHH